MSNKIQLQTNNTKLDELIEVLKGKAVGSPEPELPTLTNEGSAADMLLGKQLINSNKEVITGTIPSQEAQTITPMTTDQTIDSGKYLAGAQTIKGDANLIAENIKDGVSIFGVEGTCKGASSLLEAYTYSGSSQPIDDGDGNWRIKFLQSGTLTVTEDVYVDIFAVGGGGNGKYKDINYMGGGGAGGYTETTFTNCLKAGTAYVVTIGAAEGTSSLIEKDGSTLCEAAGGGSASGQNGGNGGSGGGPGQYNGYAQPDAASDGNDAGNVIASTSGALCSSGGKGQGSTTREFGEETGDIYAGGGGGGRGDTTVKKGGDGGGGDGATTTTSATNGGENTGGGGGGANPTFKTPGTGGSGIVIIRNARVITMITFFIDGTEYQAISGMDWGTWCDSEFNTGYWTDVGPGPTDRGDCIGYTDIYIVDGDEYVIKEDLIIDGQEYSTLYNNK